MGYLSLAGMTKTAIAVTLAGGVMVAGITWQGDGSVTNIKGNLDSLKGKLTTAIDDNAFLSGQFDSLKGLYNSAVGEANSTIAGLKGAKAELEQQKADLTAQVSGLQSDLQAKQAELDAVLSDATATEAEQVEAKNVLQAEIDRLSSELDRANQQIAELEAYAQEADSSTQYTAVDRTAYNVEAQEVADADTTVTEPTTPTEPTEEQEPEVTEPTPVEPFVSASATALNPTASQYLADETRVSGQESAYFNSYRQTLDITGITTTADGRFLAYTVKPVDTTKIGTPAPTEMRTAIMNSGVYEVYYIDETTGTPYFKIDKNGNLTKLN